jgi:hypothetical protein
MGAVRVRGAMSERVDLWHNGHNRTLVKG